MATNLDELLIRMHRENVSMTRKIFEELETKIPDPEARRIAISEMTAKLMANAPNTYTCFSGLPCEMCEYLEEVVG